MNTSGRYAVGVAAGVLLAGLASPLAAAPGDVKTSFDAPCKYPAGLASDGKNLFLLDWRAAKIYRLALADGKVGKTWDAPTLKPYGLAYGNGHLYVSDDHTGRVYVLNLDTGVVDDTFEAPGARAAGLAYTPDGLFLLEKGSRRIYLVDPADGTILRYFPVPDKNCTNLAYDGRYLWVSNRIADELYMVAPDSGMVLGVLAAPGPYAAGLAWVEGHLWNVDFQNRRLYKLAVKDERMYRLWDTREARVEFYWALNNYGPGEVRGLTVNLAVPGRLPNQELLSEVRFSTTPARLVADRWGQKCAVFELGSLPAGSKWPLTYSVSAKVSAIRYLIFPEATGSLDDIPAEIRARYTVDGARYGIAGDYIQALVKEVVGDERNPYWIARKVYNYLIDHLEYEMVGGWDVPEVVLKRGSGSCSEYTFSFVALCRAAGLPARYQGSIVVRGDDASIDEAFHRWAQVYLPNYGWVPVDANRGDAASPVAQAKGFGELANRFLITTQGGGDSEYLRWGYNAEAHYKTVGYCRVEQDQFGLWEPLKAEGTASGGGTPVAGAERRR